MNVLISFIVAIVTVTSGMFLFSNEYGGTDGFLGSVAYPTSLDTFTNPVSGDKTTSPSHATQHADANDAIEAIEAKMGINGSAVTSSFDYKLSGVTGSDLACSLTGTETLTNKILSSPSILNGSFSTSTFSTTTLNGTTTINGVAKLNLGSDATGDIFYRNALGGISRLAIGGTDNVLKVTAGVPAWSSNTANAPTGFVNATSSASTTAGISVDGTNFIQVYAYGSVVCTTGAADCSVSLLFGGQTVDTFVSRREANTQEIEFQLMWFATPSATTTTLSLTTSNVSSYRDATILYYKY